MKSAGSSAFGRKAVAHLRKVDPILAQVIDKVGVYKGWPASNGSHFDAVCRSIVFQQLSGKAAGTIHGRFQGLYGGRAPLPDELATTSDEKLRAVGLSRQKSAYLKDLAAKTAAGLLDFSKLPKLSDEEVIDHLTQVKGIGIWTAHMFLIFALRRIDVLPTGDLGVRTAIRKAYALPELPKPAEIEQLAAAWRPFCSVAAWYLWRSLDNEAAL